LLFSITVPTSSCSLSEIELFFEANLLFFEKFLYSKRLLLSLFKFSTLSSKDSKSESATNSSFSQEVRLKINVQMINTVLNKFLEVAN
jgi:hypothetical protein